MSVVVDLMAVCEESTGEKFTFNYERAPHSGDTTVYVNPYVEFVVRASLSIFPDATRVNVESTLDAVQKRRRSEKDPLRSGDYSEQYSLTGVRM